MPYSTGTKSGLSKSKTSYISIPHPDPNIDSYVSVPRVLNYSNGVRTVPIMHRAFRNLEIKYANALVADAMDYRGVSAGVGTLHCVEINGEIVGDAQTHNFGGLVSFDYEVFNSSFEDYTDGYEVSNRNPGYDIIYYSPCDDFGNMDIFNRLRRVSKKGTILGVQGIPLFSGVSVGNFVNSAPLGLAPDSDTYDSSFTVGMYNALNSRGYFSIYYQYLDCSGGGGDANADMGGDYLGDGSVCNNGTWINERPRL